jgi:uroporphyrinogen-III synthase
VRLLVTRAEVDAVRTVAALRALGHDVVTAALLRIETAADALLDTGPWAAVLITSANAVRAITTHPQWREIAAIPVFTVGSRTAAAARAAGFFDTTPADGDASDLVRLVAGRFAGRRARFLYLAGEDRAGDLAGDLAAHGFGIDTVVIYRAVAKPALPPAIEMAVRDGRIDGVLHYSRRSADAFIACVQRSGTQVSSLDLRHYCLSAQVALPLIQAGAAAIRIAPVPRESALIELIGPA